MAEEKGYWFSTENGTHIHAEEGESKEQAMGKKFKNFGAKKEDKKSSKREKAEKWAKEHGYTGLDDPEYERAYGEFEDEEEDDNPLKAESRSMINENQANDPRVLADKLDDKEEKINKYSRDRLPEKGEIVRINKEFGDNSRDLEVVDVKDEIKGITVRDAGRDGITYDVDVSQLEGYTNYLDENDLKRLDDLKQKYGKQDTTTDESMRNDYSTLTEEWRNYALDKKLDDANYYDVVSALSWLSFGDRAYGNDMAMASSKYFKDNLDKRLAKVDNPELVKKIKESTIYKTADEKLKDYKPMFSKDDTKEEHDAKRKTLIGY